MFPLSFIKKNGLEDSGMPGFGGKENFWVWTALVEYTRVEGNDSATDDCWLVVVKIGVPAVVAAFLSMPRN